MKQHLQKIVCAFAMLFVLQQSASSQITIGGGTSVLRYPFAYWYGYARTAAIYTAAEMNTAAAGGTVTTLAWYSTIASATVGPTVIYLKQVGATTAVASDTWANTISGATTVYTGTPSSWVVGWNTIDITDYAIAAGQNLEVLVETNTGGGGTGSSTSTQFQYTSAGTGNFSYWEKDNTPPTTNGTINNNRPNIMLGGLTPPACGIPGSLAATGVTSTGATISWINATTSVVEYGPAGYTPGTGATAGTGGTLAAGSASPVTLSGLNPSTPYDVNVRQSCSGGLYSANAKVTFTTPAPPPANDNCSGALAIPCGGNLTGNTTSATNDALPATTCGSTTSTTGNNHGVWFTVTPANSGSTTIATCGSSFDTYLRVYAGTCGSFTSCMGYDDDGCIPQSTITFTAVANTTYYVLMGGYGSADYGAYTISATCPALCSVPTGVSAGTITSTSANISFTGAAGNYIVEYGAPGFTPGTGATAGTGGTIVTGTTSPIALTGLTQSASYDVYVRQNCAANGFSANSTVVNFTTTPSAPANDDCSGALAIPCGGSLTGTTTGATIDALPATTCGSTTSTTGNNRGVWFTVTPAYSGSVTVASCTSSFDTYLRVYAGTCGSFTSCMGYDDDGCGISQSTVTFTAVANTTYYVLLGGYSSADYGTYTISATCPALCSAPTGVSAGTITTTSANISFTGSAGNYIVEYGAPGFTPGTGAAAGTGGTIVTGTTSPITISGLTPSTPYDVYVRQDCAANGYSANSTVANFTTSTPPPVNDEASGAILLTLNAGCTGNPYTNVSATQSASEPFPSCKGSTGYAGMWFKFIAPSSGMVRVSSDYAGGFTDSRMALFSATNVNDYSTFSIIACDDDNGVIQGTRSLFYAAGLVPGNTYYVEMDIYSSFTTKGAYCITVDELSSSMLATAPGDCVSDQASVGSYNASYTGWISLVDGAGNINANVRQTAGTATGFNSSLTIKTGTPRTTGGQPYLNRNFLVSGSGATAADLQLFFTTAEAAAIGGTPSTMNVSRVPGSTCNANFTGTATLLNQTASGSANGAGFVQVTTPGFSNFYIQNGLIVLPVSIEFLTGSKQSSNNLLNWKVNCTSAPSVTLVLERSSDGHNFTGISTLTATAVRCLQDFNYTDVAPPAGISYYRLKVITPDGAFKYSNIIALINRDKGFELISVVPNPVRNTGMLSISSVKAGMLNINVTNALGQVVMQQRVSVIAGSTTVNLDFSTLGAGTYRIIAVNSDGEKKTTGFVKF